MKERDVERNGVGRKLFNFRPVLFCALFFAWGIFCAYSRLLGNSVLLPSILAFSCAAIVPIVTGNARKTLLIFGVLALFFSGGRYAFDRQYAAFSASFYRGECVVSGRVREIGENCVFLSDLSVDKNKEEGKMKLYLSDDVLETLSFGDEIVFRAYVESENEPSKDLFSYGTVTDGLRFTASSAEFVGKTGKKTDVFLSTREKIKKTLYSGMSEDSASVAYAMFTGDTSLMPEDLKDNFRRGGIAHIFAVSGLHIGALYAFCRLLMRKTGVENAPHVVRVFVVVCVLLFYGGVCGFSASVVRAIAMCLFAYVAELFGVKSDSLERIGGAMLVVLLFSPSQLTEAGFLLSFAACFGISVFSGRLKRCFSAAFCFVFGKELSGVSGFLSVTLSAQLFTLPILCSTFGYLSKAGILLNCLFVPLLSAVFSLLLFVTFVCCLLPVGAAGAALYLPSLLFSILNFVFYTIEMPIWTTSAFSIGRSCVYFAATVCFSDKLNYRFFLLFSKKGAIMEGKECAHEIRGT